MRAKGRQAKVRIFVDFWNLSVGWRDITKALPEKNLDWAKLPSVILEHLDDILPLRSIDKELRSIKVYASAKPADFMISPNTTQLEIDEEERRLRWLTNYVDQLTGYTVDVSSQSRRSVPCHVCSRDTGHYVEQGVDTKMAIDLVALASRDLYDIAVLVTDDQDLIPSIQCVQDALDKQVVHLGFEKDNKGRKISNSVRNEAWGHLFLDNMLSSIAV